MCRQKIGLLTYHYAHNYGALLQAFSLQNTIKCLGYDSEFINFELQHIKKGYPVFMVTRTTLLITLKSICYSLITLPLRLYRRRNFDSFINNWLKVSERKLNIHEKIDSEELGYHKYICGSDQIWNPYLNNYVCPIYFLAFEKNSSKKIAYAPSFGKKHIESKYHSEISQYLSQIDYLSCREEDGVNIIKGMIGKTVPQLIDPVFLTKKQQWKEVLKCRGNSKEKYILVYAMEENLEMVEYAKKLSKNLGMKIYNIASLYYKYTKVGTTKFTVSPQSFVNIFYKAEYIITNSFHGTAFSIIFNKKFIVFPHSTHNSRLESILHLTNLTSRYVSNAVNIEENINYVAVNRIIEKERQKGIEFLRQAIEK
jgi:hypothetical protein